MTYIVSSGTLNPTIPYHLARFCFRLNLVFVAMFVTVAMLWRNDIVKLSEQMNSGSFWDHVTGQGLLSGTVCFANLSFFI